MSLERDLDAWDGTSSDALQATFDRHQDSPSFLRDLIRHAGSVDREAGATWLIKRWVETSEGIVSAQAEQLLTVIPMLEGWEAKLHILQCLPHVAIPASCRDVVESFTRECLHAENKFVRAWAYGGFYELARHFPQYRDEAESLMERGRAEEPASVRARIRRATARGFR